MSDQEAIRAAARKTTTAESLLLRLYRRQQITEAELKAGLQYAHSFALARMQGHFAHSHFDMTGLTAAPFAHANDNFTPSEARIAARFHVQRVEQLLGQLGASCFHNVLGLGMSLRDFAHKISSGAYLGQRRNITANQALGILLSGLASLARKG